MACRYGLLPHEVLDLGPWELGVALVCLRARASAVEYRMARIRAEKGMVFPTVDLLAMLGA